MRSESGVELDHDTVVSVVSRLGPWTKAHCACIDRTWNRAVHQASFPDATNGHWLVEAEGTGGRLWMCNLVSGRQEVIELNLPWHSIPKAIGQEKLKLRPMELCSFQGLLLITLGTRHEHALVLGDPLLNKWIKLPSFCPRRRSTISVGGFCPETSTLLVSDEGCSSTATFDMETGRWKVDPLVRLPPTDLPQSQLCCLDGVFYGAFRTYPHERPGKEHEGVEAASAIACYDPVNARRWQIVKEFYLVYPHHYPSIFLAQLSRDKMLLCMAPDDGKTEHEELFEASRSGGSGNDLESVPSPLMEDESIGKFLHEEEQEFSGGDCDNIDCTCVCEAFHGKDGMLFWEHYRCPKVTVASLNDRSLKKMDCRRPNKGEYPSKYYYAAAPGTRELLDNLAAKLTKASG